MLNDLSTPTEDFGHVALVGTRNNLSEVP